MEISKAQSYLYIQSNQKINIMNTFDKAYTKRELQLLDTIEQAWDGDELKIEDGNVKVWLTHRENRQWNGDYTIEVRINGKWHQSSHHFK